MKFSSHSLLLAAAIACSVFTSAYAEDGQLTASGNQDATQLGFVGSQMRIGLGFTDDGDFLGEGRFVFGETDQHAWIADAWVNNGAGGFKLDYNWLSGEDKVWKMFAAVDRNQAHDRKASAGVGVETEKLFAGLYVSKSLTDQRLVNTDSYFFTDLLAGSEGNHDFTQLQTTTVTTMFYEHPYNRGVGANLGHFYDQSLLRVKAGLDYEQGDYNSSQTTVNVGVEKFFNGTGHSLALNVEHLNKDGDFETNKSDNRASLVWRYDFGKTFQPKIQFEKVEYEKTIPAQAAQVEQKLVKNQANLNSEAFFALDKADLKETAQSHIAAIVDKLRQGKIYGKISVIGHTCDLGTESYNQKLSERRAQAVANQMISAGIDPEVLLVEGQGELNPTYVNSSEEQRKKNRRVDVSYVGVIEQQVDVVVKPATDERTVIEWRQQEIKTPAQWIKRALRNPVAHKRTVDVYKYEQEEVEVKLGQKNFANTAPVVADDNYTVDQDSSGNMLDVLSNDLDAEQDEFSISHVGHATSGLVENFGDYVMYTPSPGYSGSDAFSYTVKDSFGAESTAQVSVTVKNQGPTAVADQAETLFATTVLIDALANDTDPEGDVLSLVSVETSSSGEAQISQGQVLFTPAAGFVGTTAIKYVVSDGSNESQGVITIKVRPIPPQANADSATADAGITKLIDVLQNDQSAMGGALSIQSVGQAQHGSITIVDNKLSYTADEGFSGVEQIEYVLAEADGLTATTQLSIQVSATPNQAPTAMDDSARTKVTDAVTIDVLANDTDPDGDALSVVSITALSLPVGSLEINADQTITFTPNASWTGTAIHFSYTISDGRGGESTAVVKIKC